MIITCLFYSYTSFKAKIVNRLLQGTSNYKGHYKKHYPSVLLDLKEQEEFNKKKNTLGL